MDASLARAAAGRVLPDAGQMTTGQQRAAVRSGAPRSAGRRDPPPGRRARGAGRGLGRAVRDRGAGRAEPVPGRVALADRNIDAAARWLKDHGATGTLASLQAGGVPRASVK